MTSAACLAWLFTRTSTTPPAVGYHKLYTYTSEPATVRADFNVPNPQPSDHQDVIAEWQVSADNPDVVDPNSRREVVRINHPQFNHNSGHLLFGPDDHYLYFADGDGGNANDVGPGHNDRIGGTPRISPLSLARCYASIRSTRTLPRAIAAE